MKKQLLLIMMMLLPMVASADAVEIDGIYYNLVKKVKTAEVTSNPNKYSGSVIILEKIKYEETEYTVTSIDGGAFYGCSDLTSVEIPASVTSIGNYAFQKCSGLTSVTIPNSVTEIGGEVFLGCTRLSSISIGNSVTSIGSGAFKGSGLTSVTIPNSVTSIGSEAFEDCVYLKSVTIGNGVTEIYGNAFKNTSLKKVIVPDIAAWCRISYGNYNPDTANPLYYAHHLYSDEDTEITELIIPNSVTSIGDWAFSYCSGLTSVTIPNSVTSIGVCAFSKCSSLTSVEIPNSVTSIGNSAFSDCSGLTSVTIGNGVTSIGQGAFHNCSGLTSVNISDLEAWCIIPFSYTSNPLYYAHHLFLNGTEIKDLMIPNSVTSIGERTFEGCNGLTSVTIGNGVTSIGNFAFYDCSNLTYITIGNGVKEIRNVAFANCSKLTDVYCYAEKVPSTESNAFEGSYIEYATLHVRESLIDAYSSLEPWSNFKEFVKLDIPKYTLIYLIDDEEYKSYEIEEGLSITKEPLPTKEGYTFSGWSEIPETMPAHDVTVTGTFTVNKYKLTYMVDGEEYKTLEVEYGTTITAEEEPTKEGYTFSGWSEIPETMPAKDVVITGTFAINSYTITYKIDGEVFKTESVEYNSAITPPEVPAREGYTFEWIDVPETMPAKDITIEGSYTLGIGSVYIEEDVKWYTLEGKRIESPQKGLNIMKNSNGKTKKVVVK